MYDMLDRVTQQIAADDGTGCGPTDSTNQTTDYTYDGNGDLLSQTAEMPSDLGEPNQIRPDIRLTTLAGIRAERTSLAMTC